MCPQFLAHSSSKFPILTLRWVIESTTARIRRRRTKRRLQIWNFDEGVPDGFPADIVSFKLHALKLAGDVGRITSCPLPLCVHDIEMWLSCIVTSRHGFIHGSLCYALSPWDVMQYLSQMKHCSWLWTCASKIRVPPFSLQRNLTSTARATSSWSCLPIKCLPLYCRSVSLPAKTERSQ